MQPAAPSRPPLKTDETLLILGASARAAAHSALRADVKVAAIDLFGDVDLQNACECMRVKNYPGELFWAAHQAPPGPWMYTGGLENYPRWIQGLAKDRELLGTKNPQAVRDLDALNQALVECELPVIEYRPASFVPSKGRWLLKPKGSSGGHNVRVFDGAPYDASNTAHDLYWTPWIEGMVQGAVYVFGHDNWQLLGVCEQLPGVAWTGATGVAYGGSIGPIEMSERVQSQYQRLGERLHQTGELRGIVGVDAIVDSDERLRVLEINPRYTASVEVLERAMSVQAMNLHVTACRGGLLIHEAKADKCEAAGKAILFARRSYEIRAAFVDHCLGTNEQRLWPEFADVSAVGTRIDVGQPIITIFAAGGCVESVRYALRNKAEQTFALLDATCSA
jgi:predicted ATP-grasp superfamily ATP-dependent carboligase